MHCVIINIMDLRNYSVVDYSRFDNPRTHARPLSVASLTSSPVAPYILEKSPVAIGREDLTIVGDSWTSSK